MRKMIKEELNRAVNGKGMLLSLLIGCVVSVMHVVQYLIPAYQANLTMDYKKFPILYPFSVADKWLAGNPMSLESFIFFLVLPILAALPFGTSYFSDRKSGFLKNLYMQASRKQYLSAKYTAVFLSGGIAVLVPLLLNLLCSLVLLPNLVPATILTQNGINASCAFYELYFTAPLGYIVLFLLLDFIFGGIFACIALAASFLSDYIVIVTVCPFFVQLVLHVVCTMFSVSECSSVYFTQAGYGIKHLWVVGVYIIVGILATMVIFFHKGEREDVF